MNRIVTQLKKRIDGVDFRKIYKGFSKCNFLLRYENILYGINEEYMMDIKEKGKSYVNRNNITYAVIDYPVGNLNYNQLVVELISVMFKLYCDQKYSESTMNKELEFIIYPKDVKYYEDKYKLNLLLAKILTGNYRFFKLFENSQKQRVLDNLIVNKEIELEERKGLEKYIKLKAMQIIDPEKYNQELNQVISILEDPSKLFDYFSYIGIYGAALLLVKNLNIRNQSNYLKYDDNQLMINFQNLVTANTLRIRRIMMYKMIHARKIKLIGKLSKARIEKVLVSENLFYLPEQIECINNGITRVRKGDFIVKMNDQLEIIESYECISLDKII